MFVKLGKAFNGRNHLNVHDYEPGRPIIQQMGRNDENNRKWQATRTGNYAKPVWQTTKVMPTEKIQVEESYDDASDSHATRNSIRYRKQEKS